MSTYIHVARCPVCRAVFDTIKNGTPELNGQAAAMLLGSPRAKHRKASPKCEEHPDWVKGWVIDPPVKVEPRPARAPIPSKCISCGEVLAIPSGYAGTGMCGPCTTGEASAEWEDELGECP